MATQHGFELLREQRIAEIDTHARLWRHLKTGTELLSLENNDENKVFGITFRTPVADSTGVAHILEHCVLCGSRKYPLKDPFAELLKSSLQTFLNAFTYPDKTCYPFASQNGQDFRNLLDVYIDCVFYPRLSRETFEQQAWHHELPAESQQLGYKGVVFNEMKGAYGSPDRLLDRYAQRHLFPDTTYSFDFGGSPPEILDLTHEQLRQFHAQYYHPSNARVFFYGDDDPAERLRVMNQHLSAFDRLPLQSTVQMQPRFDMPRRASQSYATSTEARNKSMVTVNWLLPDTADIETTLGMNILAHMLVGTPAAPLRKTLIESGLGEDLAGPGLVDELRQMFFGTGLKGTSSDHVDAVESLIIDTLRSLVDQGFDPRTIEASMNTLEFRLRENNTGSFPRGLELMLRALATWLHDGDPFGRLAFEAPLEAIRRRLVSGERYFEALIREHYLDNPHRVTLLLEPDPTLGQRDAAAEQARLERERAAMSDEEVRRIVARTHELKRLQETPDPPEVQASVPALRLEDLDSKVKTTPINVDHEQGAEILFHDLSTNGILYLDAGFDLRSLRAEMLPYVPLFGRALLEMGAGDDDFVALSQRIGRATGGIRPQLLTSAALGSQPDVVRLFLRGKAMASQTDELLQIMQDVVLTPRLDNRERFRQIVLEEKAGQEARLVPAGHQVINTRLRANFGSADWAAEQMSGVSYLFFLRDLIDRVDREWDAVHATLLELWQTLVNSQSMLANVTTDTAIWRAFEPRLRAWTRQMPRREHNPQQWLVGTGANEGLVIPAQVNYVGMAADLYALRHTAHGADSVLSRYVATSWLWDRVRVQGGAYGGFASFDHRSGIWSFLSYRDPNLLQTLDVYTATANYLLGLELSDRDLARSIIGAIGATDMYQLPDARGFTSMQQYLTGESDESRQRRREQMLATSADDFRAFGELLSAFNAANVIVVMGARSTIEAANEARSGLLAVVPVL